MTTLHKAAIATVLTAAVGTGIYEVRHAAQVPERNQAGQQPVEESEPAPAAEPAQPSPAGGGELPPVVPISLAGVLVPAENDQWSKTGAFKAMPRGKQVFGGVEFWLEGVIELQSSAARDDERSYRQRITVPLTETNATAAGIEIIQRGSNVAAVHLLGATRYRGEGECTVAQVICHYTDGSSRATHVRFENHVRDWIRTPYESPAYLPYGFSKVVWRAAAPGQKGRQVRLYRFSYPNPEPGKTLQQLEFASAMAAPSLFLVGLTLDPVRLGERPDSSPNLEPTDPAQAAQIEVVVQTPDGLPLPGAKVRILADQASGKSPARCEHTQVTGVSGSARLNYPPAQDLERLEISAAHEDYDGRKMAWEMRAGDVIPASFTLKLGNGVTLGGRVVDERDAPIAGAKLLFSRFWNGSEDLVRRGEQPDFASRARNSDAQGLWQVKGVPADLLDHIGIRVSHPDYVGTNYLGQRIGNMDQELRAGTFKVVLRRGLSVAGRVIDEIGNPIAEATVAAGKYNYAGTQETKTDGRGAFTFRNLRLGEIQFSALAKGRKPETRTVEVTPDMPEILFRLGPGQTVRGIVKAATGEPVEGVRISLESTHGGVSDTYQLELKSGKDGRFEWDGAPDEALNFCFLKTGYEAKRRQTLKPNEDNVITLRQARKIEGRVLDAATEQPVTKFRVGSGRCYGTDSFYADYPGMKDYADANGRFTLRVSEEETGAVQAEAADYAAQVEPLPEAQNGVVQVVLRLKPSAALRGVLVTADGAPVAGATVAIRSGPGDPMLSLRNSRLEDGGRRGKVVTTDAAGEFILPSPPESGTVIAVGEAGFGAAPAQQVRDSGRLVLQPFGRVEGTFKSRGQPVAGQQFTLSMWDTGIAFDWGQYRATTDENGRFAIDKVPSGEGQVVRLVRMSDNSWTHNYGADVTVRPGQTAQVALGDSGATLTGRIRFETPPAAGEKLSVEGGLHTVLPPLPGALSVEEARAYQQTPEWKARNRQMKIFAVNMAEDGSWSADSVPPGTYMLDVRASKFGTHSWESPPIATGSAQVVVPEGATPETQITVDEVVLRPKSKIAPRSWLTSP